MHHKLSFLQLYCGCGQQNPFLSGCACQTSTRSSFCQPKRMPFSASYHRCNRFTFLRLQTAQGLGPEESFSQASTTSRWTSELTGDLLLFGTGISFSSFRVFRETVLPGLPGPDLLCFWLSRPHFCASLTDKKEAYDVFQSCFCLRSFSHTQVGSDPLHKDRHACHQTFSVIVHNFEAHMNDSPFSARFCSRQCRTSGDAEFFTEDVSTFCFWPLISTQLRFTKQRCFLFPSSIFASHLIFLSTPDHPNRTKASHIPFLLAFVEVRVQAPCSAFICLVTIIDIFVLRSDAFRPGRVIPSGLFSFAQYFIGVLVHVQCVRVSALHTLPEFCHYEPWTPSFLVESFDVFP